MDKKTKALSGAAQDAYFRRVLKGHTDLKAEDRDRVVGRLRQDIAQLRLRTQAPPGAEVPPPQPIAPQDAAPPAPTPATPPPGGGAPAFDPFSPNVIVLLRKCGRDGALAALAAIDGVESLLLLAREQRLGVPAGLASAAEIRAAIVAAAERRIANRMAAAT